MAELGTLVEKVRSKNAGPFWLTIDIFCGDEGRYTHVVQALKSETVAALFNAKTDSLKRFDIPDLNVIKFSLPRPVVQGTRLDRDMHGAQWAMLLSELQL